jgi:DNA-binding IclR family transcriptional regulator
VYSVEQNIVVGSARLLRRPAGEDPLAGTSNRLDQMPPKKTAPDDAGATNDLAGSGDAPNYPIGSVDKTLRLLRLFGEQRSIRIADASREIGVARSTAHRMMQMLQYHGFVRQDSESRAYSAGDELVRIGLSVVRQLDIRAVARPVMEALVNEVQETVHLVERRGDQVFFLDSIESPQNLRAGARTGMSLPAFCTSTGKVFLAELTTEELRALYPNHNFARLTDNTHPRRADLEKDLAQIRELGYATNFGESEPDIAAVAVPVRDTHGVVRASLAISAPMSRWSRIDISEWIAPLKDGAAQLEAALVQ